MTNDYTYTVGSHIQLILGDCIEHMKEMPDNMFDLAIPDPEYGLGDNIWNRDRFGPRHIKQPSGKMVHVKIDPYPRKSWNDQPPPPEYFEQLLRVSKHQIIWGVNYFDYRFGPGRIVWDKVNYESNFSDCEIAYCSLHDSVRLIRYMWNGMMQGKSIKEGWIQQGNKKIQEKRIHPCQKPVVLYRWLLQTYAKKGWRILDTHGGSASSAIACEKEGFDLMLFENDREHYKDAVERFQRHVSQYKLKLNF